MKSVAFEEGTSEDYSQEFIEKEPQDDQSSESDDRT
jgi:hypothetical protein